MKLSVVIPAYNEADNISTAIKEIKASITDISLIQEWEIIVVDDCSSDGTFDIVQALPDSQIHCVRLSRRSGSHIALRAGLSHALGDAVLCMAADCQDDPGVLKEMLKKWQEGSHTIWGICRQRQEEPLSYRLMALSFYFLLKLLTDKSLHQIDISSANFFLLDKKVVRSLLECHERNTSLFGLISWVGFQQGFVEYNRRLRAQGNSKWSFRTRMRLAMDWIAGFSGLPLRLISLLGLVIALIGFIYAGFIIINAYTGNPPPGWSETIILILVLSGFQMMITGIIGEYLWRNLDETRKRPLYFIEKQTYKQN